MKERFWDFAVGACVIALPLACYFSNAFMALVAVVSMVVLAFLIGNLLRNL